MTPEQIVGEKRQESHCSISKLEERTNTSAGLLGGLLGGDECNSKWRKQKEEANLLV